MAVIKQIKLPEVSTAYDIGVDWSNIDNKPTILTSSDVETAINNKLAANDAMIFKGTIGTGGTVTALPATHNAGWTYRVITAGTYAGIACEEGDLVICITDGTTANNAHWTAVQTNIDGAVTGPINSVAEHIATFTGTTGKVIKDSGFTIAKSVPADAEFTDTTYTFTSGTANGTILVTPAGGTAQAVAVYGLGSNAYTSTSYAPKASPALTGTPTAPTQTVGNSTTAIATTAFVQNAISGKQANITASGILKGNGSGIISAAIAGTDYAAPSTVVTQASVDSNGLVSFKNSSGTAQFTLQLPLYSGGVS